MNYPGRTSLAALLLLISNSSYGAPAIMEWGDAGSCRYEIKFDPAKYDKDKLKNTMDFIFAGEFFVSPNVSLDQAGRLTADPAGFQRTCEAKKSDLANRSFLDLPGIEDARKLNLELLDEACTFGAAESRAAAGDPAALREFTPSAAKCSRFIDALEGKTDLQAVWRDVINARCRSHADPGSCKADFEKKPPAAEQTRFDVLEYGWKHCSAAYLKIAELKKREQARSALEKSLRRLVSIKAYPCDD